MSYPYNEYRRNPLVLISFILKFILIPIAIFIAFIDIDIVINKKLESSDSQVEQQKTKRSSLLFLADILVITAIIDSFNFYLSHLERKGHKLLKNEVEAIPEYIIPDNDTQIVKDKIPWNTNEDILSQYAKYSIPVIFLAETDFPTVLKTMTAPKALEFARNSCAQGHWAFTAKNVYAILKDYEAILQCKLMCKFQAKHSEEKEK